MKWEEIEKEFNLDIPIDEPIFPVNIVCKLLNMQYYLLHEIVKEGVLSQLDKKSKKLFSLKEVKKLKYVKYLIEDQGVNIKGAKLILKIKREKE